MGYLKIPETNPIPFLPRRENRPTSFWFYFWQVFYLIAISIVLQYFQVMYINKHAHRYTPETNLEVLEHQQIHGEHLSYEMTYLRKEIFHIRNELEEIRSWKFDTEQNIDDKLRLAFDNFYLDQIGIFDYAAEYAGASVLSTPNTISYPSKYGFRIFGAFDFTIDSQPNVLLQHGTFPGKCFAFYGNRGQIRVKLGRPVVITHVSLEHLRLGDNLSSAPRDFQVLGFGEAGEKNLGYFLYDLEDVVIQTFRVTTQNQTFRSVELRILSNYGNDELTCVYRFRVHSLNLN